MCAQRREAPPLTASRTEHLDELEALGLRGRAVAELPGYGVPDSGTVRLAPESTPSSELPSRVSAQQILEPISTETPSARPSNNPTTPQRRVIEPRSDAVTEGAFLALLSFEEQLRP